MLQIKSDIWTINCKFYYLSQFKPTVAPSPLPNKNTYQTMIKGKIQPSTPKKISFPRNEEKKLING